MISLCFVKVESSPSVQRQGVSKREGCSCVGLFEQQIQTRNECSCMLERIRSTWHPVMICVHREAGTACGRMHSVDIAGMPLSSAEIAGSETAEVLRPASRDRLRRQLQ